MPEAANEDRRRARTRAALREAFLGLALSRRWSAVSVADITAAANVGRSTFYEHYRGKDDLLRDAIAGQLSALADAVLDSREEPLIATLTHFWENRHVGNPMLAGAPRRVITQSLIEGIEERLQAKPAAAMPLPRAMMATYLATAMVAALSAWLGGQASITPRAFAEGLSALARGALTSPD